MDIYCARCGEPWDIDSLHEEVNARQEFGEATFAQVRDEFYSRGCVALVTAFGSLTCERSGPVTADGRLSPAMAMSVLVDIMGDDIDGVAAMMEDYGY